MDRAGFAVILVLAKPSTFWQNHHRIASRSCTVPELIRSAFSRNQRGNACLPTIHLKQAMNRDHIAQLVPKNSEFGGRYLTWKTGFRRWRLCAIAHERSLWTSFSQQVPSCSAAYIHGINRAKRTVQSCPLVRLHRI